MAELYWQGKTEDLGREPKCHFVHFAVAQLVEALRYKPEGR
jgi:hypothetical protein